MPNAFGHELYRSYGDLSLAVSYIIITIAYILLPSQTDFATDRMNLHNIRVEWIYILGLLWFAATAGTNSKDTFAANIAMVAETLHEKYATS